MEQHCLQKVITPLLFVLIFGTSFESKAQNNPQAEPKSSFWQKVQIGGGLGLGFGSGFTNISVAPSAIYNVNQYVAVGAGLQYSYLRQRDFYNSHLYGASVIGLFNPIEQVQLSVEVEQLRADVKTDNAFYNGISDNFWNTGLFLGLGYRMENVTIGARYNILFQEDKGVYGDALMPFVRVYF
jgi:hypothetical protein